MIEKAIEIVKETKQYHILVIICDGQVSGVPQNRKIIEEASNYPMSIICVGVGDGPFGIMDGFNNLVNNSKFNNFNFVNYSKICEGRVRNPDLEFACTAFYEIPDQYLTIKNLGYLNNQ